MAGLDVRRPLGPDGCIAAAACIDEVSTIERDIVTDWTDCPEVERVPGKLGGMPSIKRSRVRPGDLVANEAEGEAWLASAYGIPETTVRSVLAFYHVHHAEPAAAP